MPPSTKRSELQRWIAERNPERIPEPIIPEPIIPEPISEAEYAALRATLAPISESYLRKLLRESGAPLDPLVEGVRQGSFDELQQSLDRLLEIYRSGNAARQKAVREIVAARVVARSKSASPGKRSEKEEMVLWLLTWLENPGVFPEWARLRRARWEVEADRGVDL